MTALSNFKNTLFLLFTYKNFGFFLLEIKGTDRKNSIMWNNGLLDHSFRWKWIQSSTAKAVGFY